MNYEVNSTKSNVHWVNRRRLATTMRMIATQTLFLMICDAFSTYDVFGLDALGLIFKKIFFDVFSTFLARTKWEGALAFVHRPPRLLNI